MLESLVFIQFSVDRHMRTFICDSGESHSIAYRYLELTLHPISQLLPVPFMRWYILHIKKPKNILLTRQIHQSILLILPCLCGLLKILSGILTKHFLKDLHAFLEVIPHQFKAEFRSSVAKAQPKSRRASLVERGIDKGVPTNKVEGDTASGKRRIGLGDFGDAGGSILVDV
jgi:hypothetical protein